MSEPLRALRARGPEAAALLDALAGWDGVWLVGGVVRDGLLGRAPGPDVDVVVEGEVDPVARRLERALGGALVTHGRFGTATLRAGALRVDLARTRAEHYARPGALPDVRPAGLREDLARRDFTVNAMALGLDGELRSADRAREDLRARRLRTLHPASFRDDPTRLLRLVRYAARLGFIVERGTARDGQAAAAAGVLGTVSAQRLAAELALVADEACAPAALVHAGRLGILAALGLAAPDPDLLTQALADLPADGRRDTLILGALAARSEPDTQRRVLTRLARDSSARDGARGAADAPALGRALAEAAPRPSAWAELLGDTPVEAAALAGALGPRPARARAQRWLSELRHVRLGIDGAHLLAAGVTQGPAVGRGLAGALAQRLDGELAPGRESELQAALRAAEGAT